MSGKGITLRVNVPGKGPEQSPTSQLGTRVPAQDYEKLRRQALANDTLFEDPYFPADESSLFFSQKLPFKPEWKRPGDFCKDPQLFSGGADRFDVKQGMLGDCWLVSAIASLTQDSLLLNRVVPIEQGWGYGYAGIFHFKFWHFGEWVDIVVDDRLPTRNGKLIFIHSEDDNEFWSALLEKAYAKLYGGYEALKGGKTSEAMEDFTGGVVESIELAKAEPDLFNKILKNSQRSSLMSCSITASRDEVEAKLDNGLIKGHAYSVTGANVLTVKGKEIKLIRIRNPWGQKEWNGDWSDKSSTWKNVPEEKRRQLDQNNKDDGEFWISFDDFRKHFTDFEVCNVTIDALYEDENTKSWNSVIQSGSWLGPKAGGCRNFPTFTNNPQFQIYLDEDDDGDGKCSCLIALMQKNRRKQKKMGVQDLCIGFSLYKAPDETTTSVDKQYVDYHLSTGTSGSFTNAREVQNRFDLDPGCYIIIPCAFKPGEEGDFLLRIFTEKSSEKKPKNAQGEVVKDERKEKLRSMFSKLAGSDGEIDSEELQDVLTASFSKEMSSGSAFSLDACRSMIAMLDEDGNGTLNYEEFENLLVTIANWKKMFFKFDKDRSGTLEKQEVYEAVRSLGYEISPDAMLVLFNRFARKRRHMHIDDFASCLSRVKVMDDTFKKRSKGGRVTLNKDEFFKVTLGI
ncbi:calpain-9-like [Halichondria panicea]|uniref:calpain-9-like n=1 Tax=Halichondria panicea TaxID=6063 RepID=UPI00312B7F99